MDMDRWNCSGKWYESEEQFNVALKELNNEFDKLPEPERNIVISETISTMTDIEKQVLSAIKGDKR